MLPLDLPLFPLPNVVLFPDVCLPLHIFEPRYRQMLAAALNGDRLIGMALLKAGHEAEYEGEPPVYAGRVRRPRHACRAARRTGDRTSCSTASSDSESWREPRPRRTGGHVSRRCWIRWTPEDRARTARRAASARGARRAGRRRRRGRGPHPADHPRPRARERAGAVPAARRRREAGAARTRRRARPLPRADRTARDEGDPGAELPGGVVQADESSASGCTLRPAAESPRNRLHRPTILGREFFLEPASFSSASWPAAPGRRRLARQAVHFCAGSTSPRQPEARSPKPHSRPTISGTFHATLAGARCAPCCHCC